MFKQKLNVNDVIIKILKHLRHWIVGLGIIIFLWLWVVPYHRIYLSQIKHINENDINKQLQNWGFILHEINKWSMP